MTTRPKPIRRTYTSTVGTTVELQYVIEDAATARIISYRRRARGHKNFRRVPHEEGQVVALTQLPWHKEGS